MNSDLGEPRLPSVVDESAVEVPGRDRWPGDVLLRPVSVIALVVVIANDRWLKVDHSGIVSGKLSDFAGLIYFPLLLIALLEGIRFLIRWKPWELTSRAVVIATAIVGLSFALIKTWNPASDFYRNVMGYFFWPGFAVVDVLNGNPIPSIRPIFLAQDRWDLIALVVLPVPILVARRVMDRNTNMPTAGS